MRSQSLEQFLIWPSIPISSRREEGSRWGAGEGETNHAIKSEMSNKPALKAPGPKVCRQCRQIYNIFFLIQFQGGFVLHVLKTCCCRAVSPNPYKEGYSRHQSLPVKYCKFSLSTRWLQLNSSILAVKARTNSTR